MIQPGRPEPLGATVDADGTNFAVYSSAAEQVELCLFDADGKAGATHLLPERTGSVWHGFLPGCAAGQRYGYRAYGTYDPELGLRCNPAQLLIDPYARALDGELTWCDALFDGNPSDSAAFVPKCVVCPRARAAEERRPVIPWADTIFYEAHVRGYTMRHPAVDAANRGTFSGLTNGAVLDHLRALGVTTIELMPVHAFIDEHRLVDLGLRNFWGYNSIAFFAPSNRYVRADGIREFRDMVSTLHDAGFEVVLDVVYNHTGESGGGGPTLSFRGLDNLVYYSTEPGRPDAYINDTGCGNTVNVDHPQVRQLILDSLHYWHQDMGVDGFRFDLAPVLGRHNHGFSTRHPMLEAIRDDPRLATAKLVAEPWDPGPGGYQLGHFGRQWAEWNDRFRDAVRRFWRGDEGMTGEFAQRLRGSADIFEWSGRRPAASINMITSHDGFTLADVVSYERRHNEANGEKNQDGHAHNFSANHGTEGPTDDAGINALRRRQRLNMLATLLLSQGTPMLLAGDEFGHTQSGNNNAYAQDNETTWLDWSLVNEDPGFLGKVRELIALRRSTPLLRCSDYVHGQSEADGRVTAIAWYSPQGSAMDANAWTGNSELCFTLTQALASGERAGIAVMINGSGKDREFRVPTSDPWQAVFASAEAAAFGQEAVLLPARSIAMLRFGEV